MEYYKYGDKWYEFGDKVLRMSEKSSTFAPVFERGLNRTNVPRESRIGSLRGQHGAIPGHYLPNPSSVEH